MTYRIGHTGARSNGKHRAPRVLDRGAFLAVTATVGPLLLLVVGR